MDHFLRRIPEGDNRERSVCGRCGFIDYENPKIVVGSVVSAMDGILLCKRAIEPRRGFWTIPAGYLELEETAEAGARREAQEEACAEIRIDRLLAIYSVPRRSQIQLIFRARLDPPDFAVGPESTAVEIFPWGEIPWDALAFPTVHWALHHWYSVEGESDFAPFSNPADTIDRK